MKRWRMMNWRQYWSETWQGFGVKNAPRYPEAYYKIVQEIPQGARVLDLGCGSGVLMQQAHMQRGAVVHGYDSSGEAVTYCKALFLNTDELDLRNLKDEHVEACDVVTLAFVLEHLDDAVRDRVLETCKGKKVIASIDAKADYNNGLTPKKLKKLFQKHFSNVQCVRHKQYVVCTGVNDGEPGI
jgi:2-polyprenyl-3-methyl-5-hydroxy-6-metoxy-1,4-benzoquinol methylase